MVDTAYILCGGKGTRMGEISSQLPKPMLPLMGKPVLEHIILQCKANGIDKICLITGHLSQVIEEYFADGSKWGLNISYFIEDEPLGTTGAFKAMEGDLPSIFWVMYGDVIFDMNLERMHRFHIQNKAELTLAAHPNDHPFDSDLIKTDNSDRVIKIFPKPHPPGLLARNLVNAALYLVNKGVIAYLAHGKSDWGRLELPRLCKIIPVHAWRTTEYIKDIGTPDRILKVTEDLKKGKPAIRNLRHQQKAIFLDRDGVLNEDKDLIKSPDELRIYPFAGKCIRQINKSEYLSIVITNQSVVARGLVDEEGLELIHARLDQELAKEGAYLDDLMYCPHHPDSGYEGERKDLKIRCTCRKPSPGMLLTAAKKYNIDLKNSWMIGDRSSDIEAGKAADCITVGLLTGNGLRGLKEMPDFIFNSLEEAVKYILSQPHASIAGSIEHYLKKNIDKPLIIPIAGNTGSGKSTLSSYLNLYFKMKGLKSLKIELDQWILSQSLRSKHHDLNEVYQIKKIREDLLHLLQGKTVSPPGYKRHPTWQIPIPVYKMENDVKILLLDGIMAFEVVPPGELYNILKVYCKTDRDKFIRNLYRLNTWKGRTEEEINALIEARTTTEYMKISELENTADIVVVN